jgi:hypothetical protein
MQRQLLSQRGFKSSRATGAHFGLTPKKYQSGETDVTGRISKIGDAGVRTVLYEAANVILTRAVKGSTLKSWAMQLAKRARMRKAKVAPAHKLAIVLQRLLMGPHSSPTKLLLSRNQRRRDQVRADRTPAARSRSHRRDDGSGQAASAQAALPSADRALLVCFQADCTVQPTADLTA